MSVRRAARMGAVVLLAVLSACSRVPAPSGTSDTATPGSARQPAALPDVSSVAPAVQQQLRDQHDRLNRLIANPAASSDELAAGYGAMGQLFVAAEFFDAAEARLAHAEALAPADMRWPYFRAHVARLMNDPAAAAAAFQRVLAQSPEHVPSLVWLAEIHLAGGRAADAVPLLEKAQRLAPTDPAVAYGLGRAALESGDHARAVSLLEQTLAMAPAATRVHYPLALAYRALGDRTRAEAHLRQRGEADLGPVDPLMGGLGALLQNAAAYETRGTQAIAARQWGEAVTQLRAASALAPSNAFTRLNLGTALYQTGDAPGALAQFREAVRLDPRLAKAHYAIGVLMEVQGLDADAVKALTAAVDADAGYVEARMALANALRRTGRTAESLPHYDAVLKADPGLSPAAFGRAIGLVRLGQHVEARDRLREAAAAFPEQPGIAHALARLMAASPDARVRDGSAALALMKRLLPSGRTLGVTETMAMALAEVGAFDEAVTWQRQAVEAARNAGQPVLVARLTANLRLYEQRQPCRVPWADDDPIHRPAASTP
jgi:tetratricopeptide (TPR) repeat protein